jgi:hypothetical protein
MGYIQRVTGTELDFKKIVYSTWFMIPAASFTAAAANNFAVDNGNRWMRIIPLLTFGPETVGQETPIQSVLLGQAGGVMEPPDIFGTELGTPSDLPQGLVISASILSTAKDF